VANKTLTLENFAALDPAQFCRVELSGPTGEAVVIVLNNAPHIPAETRLVLAVALGERYEQASIVFIDTDSSGQADVSTATESDPFAVAVATVTYKAACGWDESGQFRISVDGVPYTSQNDLRSRKMARNSDAARALANSVLNLTKTSLRSAFAA